MTRTRPRKGSAWKDTRGEACGTRRSPFNLNWKTSTRGKRWQLWRVLLLLLMWRTETKTKMTTTTTTLWSLEEGNLNLSTQRSPWNFLWWRACSVLISGESPLWVHVLSIVFSFSIINLWEICCRSIPKYNWHNLKIRPSFLDFDVIVFCHGLCRLITIVITIGGGTGLAIINNFAQVIFFTHSKLWLSSMINFFCGQVSKPLILTQDVKDVSQRLFPRNPNYSKFVSKICSFLFRQIGQALGDSQVDVYVGLISVWSCFGRLLGGYTPLTYTFYLLVYDTIFESNKKLRVSFVVSTYFEANYFMATFLTSLCALDIIFRDHTK